MMRNPWIPPAVWAALILVLTSLPGSAVPQAPGGDKAAHAAVYAVLGLLTARATARRWPARLAHAGAWCTAAIAAFAAMDEVHQALIPGRVPDLLDLAADLSGAAGGVIAWMWLVAGLSRRTGRR